MKYTAIIKIPKEDEQQVDEMLSSFDEPDFNYQIETRERYSEVYLENGNEDLAHRRATWVVSKLNERRNLEDDPITGFKDNVKFSYSEPVPGTIEEVKE